MSVVIYGIKSCDTMKKACTWLNNAGVAFDFHDYKKAGVSAEALRRWCESAGWEKVLNRAGTTFRKLPDAAKVDLDQDKAIALMCEQPSMIKRPVLETDTALEIGFKAERYADMFAAS
jgi:Spx/MgsR family transcriptional regulator